MGKKYVSFGRPSNLHTCLSRVAFYWLGKSLCWKFLPMSFLFLLAHLYAFTDVPQLRFRSRYPNLCLMGFERCQFWPSMKSLLLGYTHRILMNWLVSWSKVLANDLFFFWRLFARLPMCHTRVFGLGILNYASWVLEDAIFWPSVKLLHMCFPSRVLTNWSVSWLDILANDSFFFWFFFACLAMCHTCVLGLAILNYG